MNKQEANQFVQESIEHAIKGIENGVVVVYHDHLSMDAFKVYVRKDRETLPIEVSYRYRKNAETGYYEVVEIPNDKGPKCIEALMVRDSEYYGTAGLTSTVRNLCKHYNLNSYLINIGWYTFPSRYLKADNFLKYMPSVTNPELVKVGVDISELYKRVKD